MNQESIGWENLKFSQNNKYCCLNEWDSKHWEIEMNIWYEVNNVLDTHHLIFAIYTFNCQDMGTFSTNIVQKGYKGPKNYKWKTTVVECVKQNS